MAFAHDGHEGHERHRDDPEFGKAGNSVLIQAIPLPANSSHPDTVIFRHVTILWHEPTLSNAARKDGNVPDAVIKPVRQTPSSNGLVQAASAQHPEYSSCPGHKLVVGGNPGFGKGQCSTQLGRLGDDPEPMSHIDAAMKFIESWTVTARALEVSDTPLEPCSA